MKKLLLLLFMCNATLPLCAQDLKVADRTEIQQRALRQMRQFEGLLNLLAKPNEYVKTYDLEDLIEKYYTDSSNYQLFLDSTVVIEGDILPTSHPADHSRFGVGEYLTTFYNHYEKSPVSSVFFSNYEISPVRQGDVLSVEVYYDVQFENHHRDYPDLDYPTHRRKATLLARYQSDNWRLIITGASYVPEVDSPAPATTTNTAQVTNETDSLFVSPREAYKIGKAYALPVRTYNIDTSGALVLYRYSEPIENLSHTLADSSLTWRVPKVRDGKGYRLRFQSLQTGQIVESASFEIKRKFPWWFVGAGIGAAGVLYLISSGGSEGGAPSELPAPLSPS